MATKSRSSAAERGSVTFKIGYEGKPDKPIDAVLYAFDRQGQLVGNAPLRDGQASLDVAPAKLRNARLFVGPALPKERAQQRPTLKTMRHINAYEPTWRFDARRTQYELLPIPELLWPLWFWCSCRVRGRVIKVETLGGVTVEKPICNARVHICEVDRIPWIIAWLPDPLIVRLRDELLQAIELPIPIPNPPDPPPFGIDPGFIDPVPVKVRAASVLRTPQRVALNPQPLPPVALNPQPLPPAARPALNPQPEPPGALNPQPLPPKAVTAAMSLELRSALMSRSVAVVREALIKNPHLISPYWCHWDWLFPHIWPHWFYTCEELRVVETDANGRFDTTIWYPCFGDKPDLYFWVDYSIGGTWETVYHPSMRCDTYWNYVCGSEVTIRVTDPRVHGCGDRGEVIGKKVVVKTIARQVSMGEIYRDSVVPAEKLKEGQVKEGWLHPTKPSPFADVLEPRVDFGNGLKPANITHYKWSYRTLGSMSEADWKAIDAPVSRHYRETSAPGDPVVYKSVQIAPDVTVTGYFAIIEPDLPANGEDWEVLDEGYDLASAYFHTEGLVAGKYELKLELFRNVGGTMQRIDLTTDGVEIYEITDPAPLTEGMYTTALAAADRLLIDPGTGHAVGYRLVLHVDNRVCFGTIEDVTVNGAAAGQCGFLEYEELADDAHISFRASHPGNFAWFDFSVVRVSTAVAEASASGLVEAASADGFTRAGDLFAKDVSIDTLMTSGLAPGQTPCIRAAFAETLHVYALATNGYGRLSGLDAPRADDPAQIAVKAFAITPAPTDEDED